MPKTWLEFKEARYPGRKTSVWFVRNAENGSYLGEVKWHGAWRQYTFWPAEECVWNADCLDELTAFIRLQMKERREARALASLG